MLQSNHQFAHCARCKCAECFVFEIRSRALHLVACQRTVRFCWRIVRLTNILLLFRIVRIQFITANSLLFRTLIYNTYQTGIFQLSLLIHRKHSLQTFTFCFFFFCTSLISFCNFFTFLLVLFFNFSILRKIF